uniref:RNase H type-1 domain-containing protein n=1 Tax=Nicotiana tabacum TaxID=4097 RepID=A0A1S3ZMA1_TOBAC|nr:PREDICTED: uncharacterized protein LOC107788332 [Nicotiana tabacum]
MALEMKILQLEIYVDSKIIINQLLGSFEVKKEDLLPYHQYASGLLEKFDQVFLNHVSREENHKVDALANLATTMALGENESTKKFVAKNKIDWHKKIGEALWAYQTTFRTATQATPYSLVYGVEAVLSLEQQIPSLRIAIQEGLTSEENAQLHLAELEALDEKILEAQQKLECYQARLARAFNKKVRPRSFQVGDLVLAIRRPIILNKRIGDKFTSKWDGPYVVKEAYSSGAYKIVDKDGLRVGPINGKFLKQYFP